MLLVINAGSSSIKLAVFDAELVEVARAQVSEISDGGHAAALQVGLKQAGITLADLSGAAHRVVHGGGSLIAPCRVNDRVLAAIEDCVPLAPLHNPANLMGIRAVTALAPDLAQFASFDTAFHATNPDVATHYAIPVADAARGIRRYGFHGLSFAALVKALPELSGRALPKRLLALHLGNGASICAIVDGRSVATTMGYSPLDGLTMGTRAGGIDGNAVLRLAQRHGIDGASRILNFESGLRALGGASDMRALQQSGTPEARFAVDHFCYWAVRHAGSMIAAMGGLDGIVFTGGIGENDATVRARILDGLRWAGAAYDADANQTGAACVNDARSDVAIWTVPAQEERQIATEALAHMGTISE
jgi:acetate kinase